MTFVTSLSEYTKKWAIDHVIEVEGGSKFTDHPSDKGGKTRYGCTEAKVNEHKDVWSRFNYNGDMSQLPYELAFYIYDVDYWSKLKLDDIIKIHPLLADRLFDIGVNRGVGTSATYLQRLLNVFNARGSIYLDIKIDGSIGPGTIGAINAFVAKRGFTAKKALILNLLALQDVSYIAIAENNPTQEDFSLGWSNRVTEGLEAYMPLLKTPF